MAISTVRWDFGGNPNFEQTGDVVTHTYALAGTKTFRMRVTDVLGVVTTESFTITVSDSPLPVDTPPLANRLPVANTTTTPSTPRRYFAHLVSLEGFADYLGPAPVPRIPPDQGGCQGRLAGRGRAHEHYGHVHSLAQCRDPMVGRCISCAAWSRKKVDRFVSLRGEGDGHLRQSKGSAQRTQ